MKFTDSNNQQHHHAYSPPQHNVTGASEGMSSKEYLHRQCSSQTSGIYQNKNISDLSSSYTGSLYLGYTQSDYIGPKDYILGQDYNLILSDPFSYVKATKYRRYKQKNQIDTQENTKGDPFSLKKESDLSKKTQEVYTKKEKPIINQKIVKVKKQKKAIPNLIKKAPSDKPHSKPITAQQQRFQSTESANITNKNFSMNMTAQAKNQLAKNPMDNSLLLSSPSSSKGPLSLAMAVSAVALTQSSSLLANNLSKTSSVADILNAKLKNPANHLIKKPASPLADIQKPSIETPLQNVSDNTLQSPDMMSEPNQMLTDSNMITKHTKGPIESAMGADPVGQNIPAGLENISSAPSSPGIENVVGNTTSPAPLPSIQPPPVTTGPIGEGLVHDAITNTAQQNLQNQLVQQGVNQAIPSKGSLVDQIVAKGLQLPPNTINRQTNAVLAQNLDTQTQLSAVGDGLSEIQQKNTQLLTQLREAQAGITISPEMTQAIAQQQALIAQVNQLEATKAALGGVLATSDGAVQQLQIVNALTSIVGGKPSESLTGLISKISGTQGGVLGKVTEMMGYVDTYNAASKLAKHLPIANQVSQLADSLTGPFAAFGNTLLDGVTATASGLMQVPLAGVEILTDQITDGLSYITPDFVKDGYNAVVNGFNSATGYAQQGAGILLAPVAYPLQYFQEKYQNYKLSRIPFPVRRMMIAEEFENQISGLKSNLEARHTLLNQLTDQEQYYEAMLQKNPNHPYFLNKLNKIRQDKVAVIKSIDEHDKALKETEAQYQEFLDEDKEEIKKYVKENSEEIDKAIRKCNPALTDDDLSKMDDMQKFAIYTQLQQAETQREQKFKQQKGSLVEAAGAVAVEKFKYDGKKQAEKQIKDAKKQFKEGHEFFDDQKKETEEGGKQFIDELEKSKGQIADQAKQDIDAIDGKIKNTSETFQLLDNKENEITGNIRALNDFIAANPGTPEAINPQSAVNQLVEERNFVQGQKSQVKELFTSLIGQREQVGSDALSKIGEIGNQQGQVKSQVDQAIQQFNQADQGITAQEAELEKGIVAAKEGQKEAFKNEALQALQKREAERGVKEKQNALQLQQQTQANQQLIFRQYLESKK